jgi:hypothetical protein
MKRTGSCSCGAIRYALGEAPMVVHACHCRDCQRLTGSAFVINLWIEERCVERSGPEPRVFQTKGGTGAIHEVFSCPTCATQLWSRYHGSGATLFVRGGTLDEPDSVTPDIHIFTRSKLPWVALPPGAKHFEAFYPIQKVWPAESYARLRAAMAPKA